MIETGITYIEAVIVEYGAMGVFIATMIEEIIAPIPSALVPLAAGFFLLAPDTAMSALLVQSFLLIAIPVALGVGIGSSVVYSIAYYGGKPIIERNRRWLGIGWEDIERISQKFTKGKRDEVTLFVLRLIPIIPGVALSGFCGAVRYPFYRFLAITVIATALRALVLGILGRQAGEFYTRYLESIEHIEGDLLVLAILAAIIVGLAHYFSRRYGS